jgi:hypothetical protein
LKGLPVFTEDDSEGMGRDEYKELAIVFIESILLHGNNPFENTKVILQTVVTQTNSELDSKQFYEGLLFETIKRSMIHISDSARFIKDAQVMLTETRESVFRSGSDIVGILEAAEAADAIVAASGLSPLAAEAAAEAAYGQISSLSEEESPIEKVIVVRTLKSVYERFLTEKEPPREMPPIPLVRIAEGVRTIAPIRSDSSCIDIVGMICLDTQRREEEQSPGRGRRPTLILSMLSGLSVDDAVPIPRDPQQLEEHARNAFTSTQGSGINKTFGW